MRFSIITVPATPPNGPERFADIIEQVLVAEELGYARVWLTEHHFTDFSRPGNVTLAAHLAALTHRIGLGLGVVVLPLHHPLHVAENLAVLDHLSHGRVTLGVGRGVQADAYGPFGVDLELSHSMRDEAVQIILGAWTSDVFSFEGTHWRIPELSLRPKPLQHPHPAVWQVGISANSIEATAAAGLHGIIGSYMKTLEEVEDDIELWHAATTRFNTGGVQELAHNELVYVAPTAAAAREEARQPALEYAARASRLWMRNATGLEGDEWPELARMVGELKWDDLLDNRALVGDPDTVRAKVARLANSGVDELILFTGFASMPQQRVLGSMRLFAEEVMPMFA